MTTLAVLEERLKGLREELQRRADDIRTDVEIRHKQNRGDIHQIRDELQTMNDQIWLLKLKIASYAGGGSAAAVSVVEFIKWLIHH